MRSNFDPSRQPAGTSRGGEFAPSRNPESTVDLAAPVERLRARYERAYGDRYQRGMDTADIASSMRRDIKDAVARGDLPNDGDISVTSQRYAGGASIDIKVRNWAAGTVQGDDSNCDRGEFHLCRPGSHDWRCAASTHLSEEGQRVETYLRSLHDAYNYDGSDVMTDYFDVNYYGQASVDLYQPPLEVEGAAPLKKTGTLADLKRTIQPGTVLEVVAHPHWEGVVGERRPVTSARAGGFSLKTPAHGYRGDRSKAGFSESWIDFGRASDVVFDKEAGEFSIGQIRYRIVDDE